MSIQICAVGTIATVPKLMTTENRAPFCTFRVACNDRRYDRERSQWVDGGTTWLSINAFRSLALHASESFAKGDRVIINGRLRVRQWENQEKSGLSVEIDADALGHDVRWGVSQFSKRSGSVATEEQDADTGGNNDNESPEEGPSSTDSGRDSWLTEHTTAGDSPSPRSADGFTPREAA